MLMLLNWFFYIDFFLLVFFINLNIGIFICIKTFLSYIFGIFAKISFLAFLKRLYQKILAILLNAIKLNFLKPKLFLIRSLWI